MTRMLPAITLIAAAILLFAFPGHADWVTQSMPAVSKPYGSTALGHLPDGRGVYAQSGIFYLQSGFGESEWAQFSTQPSDTDPSFVAVYDDSLAAAGQGGSGESGILSFDPSQTDSAFSETGLSLNNYDAVFRDALGLYVGGVTNETGHAVSYVSLDGATQQSVVTGLGVYSAAIAMDGDGNLYASNNDNGDVYRFSAADLETALAGTPLTPDDGTLVHSFATTGSLAVDGQGRLWSAGWQVNGISAYDPVLDEERTFLPGLDNSDYQVVSFSREGIDYVGYLNRDGWSATGGDGISYGYIPASQLVVPEASTAAMLLIGALLVPALRRRRAG